VRIWKLPPSFVELVKVSSNLLPKAQDELSQLIPTNLSLASTLRASKTIRAFGAAGRCVAFSADGRWLAAGGAEPSRTPGQQDGVAKVWDTSAFQTNEFLGAAVGSALIAAEHAADRPNENTPARIIGGHFRPVLCLAFSPDSRTLAVGSEDRGVQLVLLSGDERAEQLRQHGGPVYGLAFSPDGQTLATIDNLPEAPGVILWDITRRRPTERVKLLGHTFLVRDVAFSPDGRSLATVGGHEKDATVRIWDFETGGERVRLSGHKAGVNGVAWLPDRRHVLTASDDTTARVWQTAVRTSDAEVLDPDSSAKITAAVLSDNGRTLVTADTARAIRVWAIDRLFGGRKEKAELPINLERLTPDNGRELQLSGLAVSENGRWVAAATSRGVAVWDLSEAVWTAAKPATIPLRWLSRDQAVSARFARNGEAVYATTVSGLRSWDVSSGRETTTAAMRTHAGQLATRVLTLSSAGDVIIAHTVQELAGHLTLFTPAGVAHTEMHDLWSAELSPDGTMLVTTTRSGGMKVWAVTNEGGTPALQPLSEIREPVVSARFSHDGRTVFAAGVNRDVLLVDPITGQERATMSGHTDRIMGMGLLAKDVGLITVGREGTVKRWRAEPLMRFEMRPLPGGFPRVPMPPIPPTRRSPGSGR
jgi:WD40 repeat protein